MRSRSGAFAPLSPNHLTEANMPVTDLVALTCRAITFLSLAFALSTASFAASATTSLQSLESQVRGLPDAVLERGFWECDYTATVRLIDFGDAATCSVLNEELKARRFKGDFELMQVWWAENKSAEHAKAAQRLGGVG